MTTNQDLADDFNDDEPQLPPTSSGRKRGNASVYRNRGRIS